jgi:hypothetical protein
MVYPMPCGKIGVNVSQTSVTVSNPLLTINSIILVTTASGSYSGNYYVSAFAGYFTITTSTAIVGSTQYFNYAVVSY